MKCKEIRELMPDLAAGMNTVDTEVNKHLQECAVCNGELEEFRRTMDLLDEWQAPEPSTYFDVRLRARLREEALKPASWLRWIRKPALAFSLAALMIMSVTLFRTDSEWRGSRSDEQIATAPVTAEPGTAVGDLQALEKNNDLYSDVELLDELQVQSDVNANP
jgi:anti-sigma factor RsiW